MVQRTEKHSTHYTLMTWRTVTAPPIRSTRLSVIYYSATGHGTSMAREVVSAGEAAGAEVRLRRIAERADSAAIAADPVWTANMSASQQIPIASGDDVLWSDAIVFGTPTRYGSQAWQFRAFIDSLTPLFLEGRLANKTYSAFTSGRTQHGGQESTLLNIYVTLMHFGGILVPPGFTEELKWADGNPYGVSHVTGLDNSAALSEATVAALHHLARRVVGVANCVKGQL
jgi:NAD(P)H dehydrogenase (quinone)